MITLKFFTTLRILLGISEIHLHEEVDNILDLLKLGEKRTGKPFLHKILDPQGGLLAGSIVLVNGHNILHLDGLETKLGDGDLVALFPPGGGG
jgi:molybdopterin synthase sulfur carrier subunit